MAVPQLTTKKRLQDFVRLGGFLACEIEATLPGHRAWVHMDIFEGEFYARKFELAEKHHQLPEDETYEQQGLQEAEVKRNFETMDEMLEWVAQYEPDVSKFREPRELEWFPLC